jgi:acetyl-CoA synthetase
MLTFADTYERTLAAFRWRVPERFNIAEFCCERHARMTPDKPAVIDARLAGAAQVLSFGQLAERSRRLARGLLAAGVKAGDRVAIMLPQGHALPVAHMAVYRIGAIALPIAMLFGPDALAYRLQDAGARALITEASGVAKWRAGAARDAVEVVISADGADAGVLGMAALEAAHDAAPLMVDTGADDPGLMIYTSGTTGQPKGALHGHRVVPGHLPGIQMPMEGMPQPGDRLWTPADWAWAGGLMNMLLPALYFGVPIVAWRVEKFDPHAAAAMMAEQGVRNAFIPPTALRMMRAALPAGRLPGVALRSVSSGGEALGEETFAWGREALGLPINEFYGQTECNLIVASAAGLGVSRPGWLGKPVPGHDVRLLRADASETAPGEQGQFAVRRGTPVMFLSYWNRPEATAGKFVRDAAGIEWMTTGDQGIRDEDGYLRFIGRDDDVITSSGYRIGPGEIEDCLLGHPAVLLAAVVGKPDALRTEIIKAFLVLKPGVAASEALEADIRAFVRTRLSAHEYPREIAFIDDMPLTTTGKVIRRELRDRG